MRAAWNPTHRTQEYCTCTLYLIQFIVTCTINAQVQALSYTRVEVVLRHCDSHWCCFSCFPALLPSLLSSQPCLRQVLRNLWLPAGTAESSWLCALQAAQGLLPTVWNPGSPVGESSHPQNIQMQHCWCTPVHSSSFPAGLMWEGNGHEAIPMWLEVNSTAKIYLTLKVIVTLCWGLVAQNGSIQTTCWEKNTVTLSATHPH